MEKIIKIILWVFIAGFISIFGILSIQGAYAQESLSQGQKKEVQTMIDHSGANTEDFVNNLNTLLRFLYLIVWPLLFLSGLAVDNTLVYGSLFHFDAILLQVWSIMKDMANFSLFFIALYFIVKWMWENKISEIQSVVKKMLVAGILIQMSWWLMWAIIDISTVSILGLWGLPAWWVDTMVDKSSTVMQTPILQPNISIISTTDKNKDWGVYVYYKYWKKILAECMVTVYQDFPYIIGMKKFAPDGNPKIDDFLENACVYNQKVYRFNEFGEELLKTLPKIKDKDGKEVTQVFNLRKEVDYINAIKRIEWSPKIMSELINNDAGDVIVPIIANVHVSKKCGDWWNETCGMIPRNNSFFTGEVKNWWYTLDTIIDSTKWHIGPFITFYYSLLGYTDMGLKNDQIMEHKTRSLGIFFMKALFSILLIIPLFAMVLVLFLRIWILWLAIMFLPFLILKWIFFKGNSEVWGKFINDHFKWENLLSIIFAPVIMVFTLSMSIVFLHAIDMRTIDSLEVRKNVEETLGITTETTHQCPWWTFSVLWLVSICAKWGNIWSSGNIFFDIIQKLFALAIIWVLLFTAMKTNTIGKSIWWAIQNAAQWWMWTIPIIPMGGGVGFNAFKKEILSGDVIKRKIQEKERQDIDKMKQSNPWLFGQGSTPTTSWFSSGLKSNLAWAHHTGQDLRPIYDANIKEMQANHIYTYKDFQEKFMEEIIGKNTSLSQEDFHKKITSGLIAWKTVGDIIADDHGNVKPEYVKAMIDNHYDRDIGQSAPKIVRDIETKLFNGVTWFDSNVWITRDNFEVIKKEISKNLRNVSQDINTEQTKQVPDQTIIVDLEGRKKSIEEQKKYLEWIEKTVLGTV